MLSTILTSIAAFAATNLDDILVLTILFSAAKTTRQRLRAAAGYLAGVLLLAAIAALAAKGLRMIPENRLRLLGVIPLIMGLRALRKQDSDHSGAVRPAFLSTMLVTLGNGADNIGVYVPLFVKGIPAVSTIVFLFMCALWSLLAIKAASLPFIRKAIDRHSRWFVPAVFITLGLYILLI